MIQISSSHVYIATNFLPTYYMSNTQLLDMLHSNSAIKCTYLFSVLTIMGSVRGIAGPIGGTYIQFIALYLGLRDLTSLMIMVSISTMVISTVHGELPSGLC